VSFDEYGISSVSLSLSESTDWHTASCSSLGRESRTSSTGLLDASCSFLGRESKSSTGPLEESKSFV